MCLSSSSFQKWSDDGQDPDDRLGRFAGSIVDWVNSGVLAFHDTYHHQHASIDTHVNYQSRRVWLAIRVLEVVVGDIKPKLEAYDPFL